jgi:hypothetical protein
VTALVTGQRPPQGCGCNDASIPRDPAGRPPEPRPRYLNLHIRLVGIRSRFADRRLSVFVIEGALPTYAAAINYSAPSRRAMHDARAGRGGAVGYRISNAAKAQARPINMMPEAITMTRSIDQGCPRPPIRSRCQERLSSRYV